MRLTAVLSKEHIFLNLPGTSKEEVINNIIDRTPSLSKLGNTFKDKIKERENVRNSACKSGMAIPRTTYSEIIGLTCALATLPKNVNWEGEAKQEVRLVMMLISPGNLVKNYFRTLVEIATVFSDKHFREAILLSKKVDDVLEIIAAKERVLDRFN
jgi:mannitol/fructose-specific phosphotransferase system IIA component (Ntr-type)